MSATPCPNGCTWDAYVLGLPGADVVTLAAHLQSCQDCQALVRDRQAYYTDLTKLAGSSSVARGRRFQSAPAILKPMNLVEGSPQVESVMAAAGSHDAAVPTSMTFTSDDHRWMVKVVWDAGAGHEKLYVLSNDGAPVAGLLLRLSGLRESYLTDVRGVVDLGPTRWPTSPEPQVTVESPAATFTLNAALLADRDDFATLVQSPQNDILKVSMTQTGSTLRLRLEVVSLAPDLEGKPLRVAVRSAGGDQVVSLEPVMVFDRFESPGTLEIYFFS